MSGTEGIYNNNRADVQKYEQEEHFFTPVFSNVNVYAQNSQNTQNLEWEEILSLGNVDELPNIAPEYIPPILKDYCLSCANHWPAPRILIQVE